MYRASDSFSTSGLLSYTGMFLQEPREVKLWLTPIGECEAREWFTARHFILFINTV